MDLEEFFLIMGMVLLIGFTGRLIRQRTKVPESLFLILFGLLLGPITGLAPGSLLLEFLPIISVAAMVAILVESGIEFNISRLKSSLGSATIFTFQIALYTTILVTAFLYFFFDWPLAYAALLGLISSGTTTITAMALLNSVEAINNNLRRVILLETIINDFTLILGTFLIVEFIKVSSMSLEQAGKLLFSELSVGIMIGLVSGLAWRYVLTEMNRDKGLNYVSTIGVCFVLYFLASFLGGNSIIAIFTFSLLLGNYQRIYSIIAPESKEDKDFADVIKSIRSVQTDFSFFISSFFFVLLGVTLDLALFDSISPLLIVGIIVLIILSRFLAATISSKMDKIFSDYRGIISIMIPRGYVAAVLAFVPAQEGIIIPNLTDIIVLLLITTTIISILGTTFYARNGKKAKK